MKMQSQGLPSTHIMDVIRCPTTNLFYKLVQSYNASENVVEIEYLLEKEIDWIIFIDLVVRNEVLPIIYLSLKKANFHCMPTEIVEYLCHRYELNLSRNKILSEELAYLNGLFSDNYISIINYKSQETLELLGYSLATWQFNDLDFLIHSTEMNEVCDILHNSGYRMYKYSLTGKQETKGLIHQKDITFIMDRSRKGNKLIPGLPHSVNEYIPLIIEPHLSIIEKKLPLTLNYDGFWNRVQTMPFLDRNIPIFSLEDLLLVLCISGSKSGWKNIKLIILLSMAIEKLFDIDWEVCFDRARQAGGKQMLLLGLLLAKNLMNAKVPAKFLEDGIIDNKLIKYEIIIINNIFKPRSLHSNQKLFPNKYNPIVAATLDRPKSKIVYAWLAITTPNNIHLKRFPLPEQLKLFYYFIVPAHDFVLLPLVRLLKRKVFKTKIKNATDILSKNYAGKDAIERFRKNS